MLRPPAPPSNVMPDWYESARAAEEATPRAEEAAAHRSHRRRLEQHVPIEVVVVMVMVMVMVVAQRWLDASRLRLLRR